MLVLEMLVKENMKWHLNNIGRNPGLVWPKADSNF